MPPRMQPKGLQPKNLRPRGLTTGPGGTHIQLLGITLVNLLILGSLLHGRLPPRFRTGAVIAGNLIIAFLGARILVLALT
jgi:hypothetical protein